MPHTSTGTTVLWRVWIKLAGREMSLIRQNYILAPDTKNLGGLNELNIQSTGGLTLSPEDLHLLEILPHS